jgi:DNA-binding NarL/FixJ family response regulator
MIARMPHDAPPRLGVIPATEHRDVIAARNAGKVAAATSARILVADDHEIVRCGLRTILEMRVGWKIVAEAGDGKSAIAKTVENKPDVAIIDASLPLMNGIEVTREIRARSPGTEVLVLATHESEALVRDFLRAGGRAYLLKSDANRNLIAAVEALAMHRAFFTASFSETLVETFLSNSECASDSSLTPRERVVVQLVAEGCSNKQMSTVLNLSVKTIETHRAAAMRKINVTSTAGLVRYAVRNGLVEP